MQSNCTQVEGFLQNKIDVMPPPRKLHRVAGMGGNVPLPPGAAINYTPRDFADVDTLHQVMMAYSWDLPAHIQNGVIEFNR